MRLALNRGGEFSGRFIGHAALLFIRIIGEGKSPLTPLCERGDFMRLALNRGGEFSGRFIGHAALLFIRIIGEGKSPLPPFAKGGNLCGLP